jgi:hypothetical protein
MTALMRVYHPAAFFYHFHLIVLSFPQQIFQHAFKKKMLFQLVLIVQV